MNIYKHYTPLGMLLLEYKNTDHFTRIWFANQDDQSLADYPYLVSPYNKELKQYFSGKPIAFNWPLQLEGTPFQIKVWQLLAKIPYGTTVSYKQLCTQLSIRAYQAVGQAVKANPIAIIIPCHRVIGSHNLGGYHYGLTIKRFLLELENVLPLDHC